MINRDYWGQSRAVSVAGVFDYSDQYSTSYPATRAVDGNTGNYWQTRNPVGAYITVELTEAAAIESLRWYVGSTSYYATAFTVAGSNDGAEFTDLFSGGCTATSGWQAFSWKNDTPYKYIRVTCDAANSSRLYTYELEFGMVEKMYFDRSYGKYIVAVFDGPVSAPVESDVNHFTVTTQMAVIGEDGRMALTPTARKVVGVTAHPDVENAILIALDSNERLDECWGPVVLTYNGAGSLTGYGRPVEAFEAEFEPQGIAYKGDQSHVEHIELKDISATGVLVKIEKMNVYGNEHIGIADISVIGTLTHIDDI